MKKTFSIIALVMAFLLCAPSVSCYAADSGFEFHTPDSVDGYFDNSFLNTMIKNIYCGSDTFASDLYNAYNSLDLSQISDGDYSVLLYGYVTGNFRPQVVVINNDYVTGYHFVCTDNVSSGIGTHYILQLEYTRPSSGYVTLGRTLSYSNGSWSYSGAGFTYFYGYSDGSLCNETLGSSSYPFFLCDANCDVYANTDIVAHGGTAFTSSSNMSNVDFSAYTNFNPVNLPYTDSSGNIITPAPDVEVESNSNHMYFQSCDLGFCEPTDIKNFTSFGGAYLYCKYTLDNWVINHINEYEFQFNVVAAIGSEQNNFSYTMRVDRNGFVTIPFSYLFQSESSSAIPINRGFAAVVTNQKLGSDYNIAHLYSVANSNVPNFVRTLGAEYNYNLTDLGWSALKGGTLKYLCAWVSDGGTISMNNLSEWSENVAQSFNPYILRVNVKLVSGNDTSGDYAEKFDLYAGDQTTVDTSGLVNNDPFVPDVDQDDGDLPSVPEDPNSTTPSTTIYTGGTFTGNFNGVIGFDPGYRDLKADLDADPDDNFTQYLAPFKNNEVGGFVGDFLDDMPTALKSIFIGGFGVLTLLGIYRFIRRG